MDQEHIRSKVEEAMMWHWEMYTFKDLVEDLDTLTADERDWALENLEPGVRLSTDSYHATYNNVMELITRWAGLEIAQDFDRYADGSISFLFDYLPSIQDKVPHDTFVGIENAISEAAEKVNV